MLRSPLCFLLVGPMIGCVDGIPSKEPGEARPQASALASSLPGFRDATAGSGIRFVQVCGGRPDKPTILESSGSGVCLIDADGDRRLDVLLINGSTVERELSGEPGLPPQLFRSLGGGRF